MAKGIIAGGSGSSNINPNPNPTPTPEQNSAIGVPRKIITNLLVSAWDAENSQVVDVLSLSADKNAQLVHVLPDNAELYTDSGIVASVVEAGKMKFTAETVPEVDLEVMIVLEELGTQNPEAPDELVFVESGIPVVSDGKVPVDFDVWIDTTEEVDVEEEEEESKGVDIPAQDTEPEEGLFWLDTSENPEIPGGGGGNASISISNDEPTNGEQLWIDLDDEEGVVPSGVEMELLWENASPDSEFAAQTIALDLSEYDKIAVLTTSGNVSTLSPLFIFKVGNGGVISMAANWPTGTSFTLSIRSRMAVEITNSGIVFGDAYHIDINNTNGTVSFDTSEKNNMRVVPYQIYGIKGVKTV